MTQTAQILFLNVGVFLVAFLSASSFVLSIFLYLRNRRRGKANAGLMMLLYISGLWALWSSFSLIWRNAIAGGAPSFVVSVSGIVVQITTFLIMAVVMIVLVFRE